jgi:hypothetical protein
MKIACVLQVSHKRRVEISPSIICDTEKNNFTIYRRHFKGKITENEFYGFLCFVGLKELKKCVRVCMVTANI